MSVMEWFSPLRSEHWYFPVLTSPLNSSMHRILGSLFLGCFRKITSLCTEFTDMFRFLEIALMESDSFSSFIIVSFSLLLIVCFLGTSSVSVLNLFPQCLQLYLVVFIFSIGCFAYKCNFLHKNIYGGFYSPIDIIEPKIYGLFFIFKNFSIVIIQSKHNNSLKQLKRYQYGYN